MAVYLTPNTQFKPFSYQEMLAPVLAYKEAYDALETEMSNLDILAGSIESKLNPEDAADRETLKKYQTFQKDMESAMNDFYKSGYSTDVKKKFNSLKTQYAKDLDPINQAYERRLEDEKFLRQQKVSNSNLIIEGIGGSTTAYMNGNMPNPTVVNLNTVSEAAKNASTGLSKQFIDQIGLQGVEGYIGEYLMYGVQKGITSDMVNEFTNYVDAIKNDRTGQFQTPQGKALYNMFEQIRTANNYDKLSQAGKDRLDASIIQGLVSGAAADESINYTADRHWDIEAKKQSIEYTKARMQALRDKGNSSTASTDLDLRTNTTTYTGKNFDIAKIADLMGEQFKEPIEHNGTKIYDPIQAYNVIHKDDTRITNLEEVFNSTGVTIRDANDGHVIGLNRWYMPGDKKVYVNGVFNASFTEDLKEYIKLQRTKEQAYKDLEGIALSDKEVARIREYSKSSSTGMLTQDELSNFATVLASDFTAYSGAQKTATIFSQTNSKDGLEDVVKTISNNVMQEWQHGNELKITTPEGKEIKDKEFKKLIDSKTGALDASKISSVELDFIAAERGAVKLVTTDGKVYYIDADYIGDQAKAFIRRRDSEGRAIGLFDKYEDLMKDTVSKTVKAQLLNNYLSQAADAIQPQFVHNRQKGMKETVSDEYLFGQTNVNLLDEE